MYIYVIHIKLSNCLSSNYHAPKVMQCTQLVSGMFWCFCSVWCTTSTTEPRNYSHQFDMVSLPQLPGCQASEGASRLARWETVWQHQTLGHRRIAGAFILLLNMRWTVQMVPHTPFTDHAHLITWLHSFTFLWSELEHCDVRVAACVPEWEHTAVRGLQEPRSTVHQRFVWGGRLQDRAFARSARHLHQVRAYVTSYLACSDY